ncbi:aminotransferase class V-fold PLP-dependent enzyme [Flavobacterium fluviale]|uniref:Selenocysteine lyase n=1 Tax=Flavobacterium fluviale TaxID=2249356 RepID=A0A344LTU8_9FLAO|nr:aminotransferase class V-fold PLP-dependent enzyme [Flavobacterium fluviale]AXB57340.1 selenocysteine lyase [Flavobacterium fluviale]
MVQSPINKINIILNKKEPGALEQYFSEFRENTIGFNQHFESIYGSQNLLYADWIASGRLYGPIEEIMLNKIGPMIANTHSFSSQTGKASTYAYQFARQLIKKHVNAAESDCLVATGTGMTATLNKLQRIIGLCYQSSIYSQEVNSKNYRPVVFITHMEHHSNQVPWYETDADVVVLPCGADNLVDPEVLNAELKKYKDRSLKIGSFTACSNVTGIITPYYELAKIMHQHDGYCFVDFAASAPYVKIDMHPEDPQKRLDAVFFSPHKFLGGPGSCGILIFNEKLYKSNFPDNPRGGNVKCTDPWGGFHYSDSIEVKEDGGTPGFLQVMRTALCLELKEKMDIEKIRYRERELLDLCFAGLQEIKGLTILGDLKTERIGCVSFTIQNIHYNLIVRLLNDRFGIQVRGGWSCASTYAHFLFNINQEKSEAITAGILGGNLTDKPGWVRISLHPTMSDKELLLIIGAVSCIVENIDEWQKAYQYNSKTNEFENIWKEETISKDVEQWFVL